MGSTLVRHSIDSGFRNFSASPIPWTDPEQRLLRLEQNLSKFVEFTAGAKATIIWAAGRGGVIAHQSDALSEWCAFSDLVGILEKSSELHGAHIVICSSAGGVYGGSQSPPFTIDTVPVAISAYGQEKIDIERLADARLSVNYRVLLARLSNLYGAWPGARQGLVNRLCTSAVTREPIQIYVTLDTSRDYVDVNDAAQILFYEIEFSRVGSIGVDICLVGSGRTTSVGAVIATVTDVSRRRIPISLSDLAFKELQPTDLRVVPTWIERGLPCSPVELPVGTKRLLNSLIISPRWD